jgi:hypothetical protein
MPAILDRVVKQLMDKGYSKSAAYAIGTASLQKSGNLKKGTQKETSKGKARGKMTPGARAEDRARKEGRKGPFKYNAKTNRVTKKK